MQALVDARFGDDSPIHKALLQPKARDLAERYALLHAVEVFYDVIDDRWQPSNSWGFHVDLEFRRNQGDAADEASVSFTIPSGLDPPESAGWTVLEKDFVPRETLGAPHYRGSSESSGSQRISSFFLTQKGASRFRTTGRDQAKTVDVYSAGDLKAVSPGSPSITVQSHEIYDDDLAALARFTNLELLNIGECEGITDAGLRHLAGLKRLKSLSLSGERLSGTGFGHLRHLPALTDLTLYLSQRLTDQGIAELADFKQLTRLHLHWASGLTDDQLARLARLPALRELNIWGSGKMTDIGLRHVSTMVNLEALTFSHSPTITARGIAQLARLRNLRDLSLGFLALGDDAMRPLSQFDSLEYVEMHGLEISDQGIQSLKHLPHLRRLYVEGCHNITIEGVKKLKVSLKPEYVLD